MKIYCASSWKNPVHPAVVHILRRIGHEVYDYRQPDPADPSNRGFDWKQIDPQWEWWSEEAYLSALSHPLAARAFHFDMGALRSSDACVITLPSGNSSHLELGWAAGAGKDTTVILGPDFKPDLMYLMCNRIIKTPTDLFDHFGNPPD